MQVLFLSTKHPALSTTPLFQHAQNVRLPEDDELFLVDFDVGAGVFAIVDGVADAHADLHPLAVIIELAGPTEMTLPLVGFSFAESGSTIPLLVFSSASDCFTITRSARGLSFIMVGPL